MCSRPSRSSRSQQLREVGAVLLVRALTDHVHVPAAVAQALELLHEERLGHLREVVGDHHQPRRAAAPAPAARTAQRPLHQLGVELRRPAAPPSPAPAAPCSGRMHSAAGGSPRNSRQRPTIASGSATRSAWVTVSVRSGGDPALRPRRRPLTDRGPALQRLALVHLARAAGPAPGCRRWRRPSPAAGRPARRTALSTSRTTWMKRASGNSRGQPLDRERVLPRAVHPAPRAAAPSSPAAAGRSARRTRLRHGGCRAEARRRPPASAASRTPDSRRPGRRASRRAGAAGDRRGARRARRQARSRPSGRRRPRTPGPPEPAGAGAAGAGGAAGAARAPRPPSGAPDRRRCSRPAARPRAARGRARARATSSALARARSNSISMTRFRSGDCRPVSGAVVSEPCADAAVVGVMRGC